ncbi:low affinity potassium transporter [Friedmanniomyces endolithicus]|uniref:Potassium transport protein n=1 Tax=Rachicladosporium monterosium TaxID=1507873 RepID=A0ABR0LES4_9PEZI|nr:low affinity potassium transporter [Friedmanniomyces endolithicus]KAK5147668.1 low affinity potassium transporter [Rachicladosporium monterosium]
MVLEESRQQVGKWVRMLDPRKWHLAHPNFITVHYMYIIGCTIIGSILIYPAGGLAYIDALFFTAGASTQAGLNSVNTNDILLYQQIVVMLLACIANPIFINSAVVFVRLYWFEKRFQHLVRESRSARRSRSRTFSKSKSEIDKIIDPGQLEKGVNGREIRVLHDTTTPNGMSGNTVQMSATEKRFVEKLGLGERSRSVSPTPESSNRGSNNSDEVVMDEKDRDGFQTAPQTPSTPPAPYLGLNPGLKREITFADEVSTPHAKQASDLPSVPEGTDMAKHIRFLEQQQRHAKDKEGTLRIPGPRDFDRGEMPAEVDSDDEDNLHQPLTRDTSDRPPATEQERARRLSIGSKKEGLNADDHPPRAITFNEPDHIPGRARAHMKAAENTDDAAANDAGFRQTLCKVKSNLTRRRGQSHSRSQGGGPNLESRNSIAKTFSSLTTARTRASLEDPMPYLSWQATIGRNSAFLGLTEDQRDELGGIEYRALKTLAKVLILYFVGFHLLGMVVYLPWILHTQGQLLPSSGSPILTYRQYVQSSGTNPVWWGIWTPASMFNDLGFTLTPDSMNSFNNGVLPLLFGSFLIIIGNTGFPCMLRFVIWVASILVPTGTGLWEELRFLLDHPRRCFTLLFPSKATWWLFWILAGLNGLDLIFFVILDLNDSAVTTLPAGLRVLDGWFQATSTRTAGFSCINLAALHPAIQVSYLVMMYISVFPIAISVRRTNVYEEKSLGIWGGEEEEGGEHSYVGQHLRRQLSFDLWYVFLGFFVICIVEGAQLANTNNYAFTMFSVLFEIVSAYGTVGLSLGYPNIDASFSTEFHVVSKLVIIAMMVRGRHRGLPYALDRAILLPSENLKDKDKALDRTPTMQRRMSVLDPSGRQQGSWEDGELDESGLPKQHSAAMAMSMGAGGEASPEGLRDTRKMRRRSSGLTNGSIASGREGGRGGLESGTQGWRERRKSFAAVLASGLSAGPSISRNYE